MESLPQYLTLTTLAITKGGLLNCDMGEIPMMYPSSRKYDYSNVTCGEDGAQIAMTNVSFYQLFGTSTIGFTMGIFQIPQYYWFYFTYIMTLVSCTFGILRFLDVGPARILEKEGWRNFAGFGLAFVSVILSLHTKALGLGTGGFVMHGLIRIFGFGKQTLKF